MSYIQVEQVSKAFGDRTLFNDISFSLEKGDKTALIAKNGTGKTTLLKMIAGAESCDSGQIVMESDIHVNYLSQEPHFNPKLTVFDAVLENCREHREAISFYQHALESGNEDKMNKAIAQMDAQDSWDIETRLRQMLGNLDLADLNQPVSTLSGGELKRLALATTFIDEPDFVILDEPTNHLDIKTIEWLENHLSQANTTMLMVTHDRYFLDRICNSILELDQNTIFRYEGNFEKFLEQRRVRSELQNQQTEKARAKLKQEQAWANRMPKARTTKAKFRLDGVEKLKEEAQQTKEEELTIKTGAQRIGKKVINLEKISKSFENKKVVDSFSYQFLPGEKIGIVGPNGAGKSTLLNLISGDIEADNGKIEVGETIKIAYYRQRGLDFDEQKLVIDIARDVAEVVHLGNGKTLAVERFLNQFLFPNEMHYQRVEKLSGGEKRRLYLLTVLMQNPNFLILDEPTNDLDIMTLAVLEDYLDAFQGSVIIVSHDRYFMDRIVDHIFVFRENGKIKDFPGNYTQLRYAEGKADNKKTQTENPVPSKAKPKSKKNKLSYKETRELETLEHELDNLQDKKARIEQQLTNPEGTPEEIEKLSAEFEQINQSVEDKELRWLELSELKEQYEKDKKS